jgi:hypothetical protein
MTLVINDQPYFELVRAHADKVGLGAQLDERLKYLDEYAEHGDRGKTRCSLFRDSAPYSFFFRIERRERPGEYVAWFVGGLIFHGQHDNGGDGSYPTLAVCLSPMTGWQIHT